MKIVAVRVPEEIKKKMKDVPEDWSEYIRKAIEERIYIEERKRILREVKELLKDVPKPPKGTAAKLVREMRDSA
jgi:chemotaxis regulatin CheY-phosphate phosphatase CheZ